MYVLCVYICMYIFILTVLIFYRTSFFTEYFAKADYDTESEVIAIDLTMLFFSEGLWNNFETLG